MDQDDLSKCSNESVVHDLNDHGLLQVTPVMLGKLGVLR